MEIGSDSAKPIKKEELFKAVELGDSSVFNSLAEEQLHRALSLRNEDGRSLLHVAVSSSQIHVQFVIRFIKTSSASYVVVFKGTTERSIHVFLYVHAISFPMAVEILSDAHASVVNSPDEEGWAPLHSAASSGNLKIVEILLNKGADTNLKNDGGRTALHYSASKGHLKIAEILISHGAKLNMKDKVGCTPLHRAASTGNTEVCEFLIDEGAAVDDADRAGQTPLMIAVECCNREVALLLIRHGADVDAKDREGYTVLGRASDDLRPILVEAAKAILED